MDIVRVGDKLINKEKVHSFVDSVFKLRQQGLSQQDVAKKLRTDRTIISRLEGIGEIRKGASIAVIGFPLKNKEEIEEVLLDVGIEFYLLMTEAERWDFVGKKNGLELLNRVTEIIAKARACDVVIIIGSNSRIKVAEALLDKQVLGMEIGQSPIEEDKYVDPEQLRTLLASISNKA
ncbi:transcriptional regulator with XRE-family HTH domain [Desulfitispora alkaliphila]|uniref:transcriptional regulator n=1 Tax=Desulfitispora alkaliphila TaxID=622674 RepID=UPI003D25C604